MSLENIKHGRSVKPDVAKIMSVYSPEEMKLGDTIPYTEIYRIIQTNSPTRMRTVTNKWRQVLEAEYGIILQVFANDGFQVAPHKDRVDLAQHHQEKSRRQRRKSATKLEKTDYTKLNDTDRLRFDRINRVNSAVELAERNREFKAKPKL